MRACGACRRRKIKCDAATTNSWPCAACQKQHLECIPPSSDKDSAEDLDGDGSTQPGDFQNYPPQYDTEGSFTSYSQSNNGGSEYATYPPSMAPGSERMSSGIAPAFWSSHLPNAQTYNESFGALSTPDHTQHEFRPPTLQKTPSTTSWRSDGSDPDLADALQDLKIDQGGVGSFF